jgi:glycosyltransferase involved in cell wall biosynthesis
MDNAQVPLGVSIAVCTHNGEELLPRTLAYLKDQRGTSEIPWEVVVIDNASSDNTSLVARQCWGNDAPAPIRVISEPRLGLGFARQRAFEEAHYEIVSFIDDDNWVGPEWVTTASRCMSEDRALGAIGSTNIAIADVPFPAWFHRYHNYYAVWDSPESAKIATWFLTGAGMTVRKSTWHSLKQGGFHPQLIGRLGRQLNSCEDVELGCAIRLAGWMVRIEPRLELKHHIASERLRWRYLRRLVRHIGRSEVVLDSYLLVSQSLQANFLNRLRLCWWTRLVKESINLVWTYSILKVIRSFFCEMEGDAQVAAIELRMGRLLGLVELRSRYREIRRKVAQAPWRKVNSVDDLAVRRGFISSTSSG